MENAECADTRFGNVINSAMDAIILVDAHSVITVFNPAAEEVFRCSAAEAIGESINKFLPARFHEVHDQHMCEYARSGTTTRSMHAPGIVTGLRADGEEFPVEATISGGEAAGEPFYAVILRDITQRQRAEGVLRRAENAQANEAIRLYQHERTIASAIQQQLFPSALPNVPFATVRGRNIACQDVGGDFYDMIATPKAVAVVIADACGKGISAALHSSILQGIIYSQLISNTGLSKIAEVINQFLCARGLDYATVIISRVTAGGKLEFVNCGHLRPLLISGHEVSRLEEANLPVGMFPNAGYQSGRRRLHASDRLLLVSDGLTEAENSVGACFGDERLERLAATGATPDDIFAAMQTFCDGKPQTDDCTVLELTFHG